MCTVLTNWPSLAVYNSDTEQTALMRGSRKFCERGFNIDNGFLFACCLFFQLMREGGSKYHSKRVISVPQAKRHLRPSSSPPAKRHLNGVSLVGRWWPNIDWMLAWLLWEFCEYQGSRSSIAKKPYIFFYFSGGGGTDPLSPSLNPRMALTHSQDYLRRI